MKKLTLFTLLLSFLLFSGMIQAQNQFTVPEITPEEKQDILYNHVMAYNTLGLSFAKTKGVSPADYGSYIGNYFKVLQISISTSFYPPRLCQLIPSDSLKR